MVLYMGRFGVRKIELFTNSLLANYVFPNIFFLEIQNYLKQSTCLLTAVEQLKYFMIIQ